MLEGAIAVDISADSRGGRRQTSRDRVSQRNQPQDVDATLVARLRIGDELAFAELVKRYERRLLSAAMRITANCEDAEEVVQDTFLKVFRHIDSFRGNSLFSTWLTRIAINEALMKVRGKVSLYLSFDEDKESGAGPGARSLRASGYDPEESYALHQIEVLAVNLLHQTSHVNQPAMKLCIQMDLSLSEIAERLRINLSTVKSRLFRGRKELREAFARHCSRRKSRRGSVRALYR